jgi:hypothetical protein
MISLGLELYAMGGGSDGYTTLYAIVIIAFSLAALVRELFAAA